MNVPSIARLGLLPNTGGSEIAVAAEWVCDHAVLIECSVLDEDDLEELAGFEVVFEPDFSLDDDDGSDFAEDLLALIEQDEDDDEEDDWPY